MNNFNQEKFEQYVLEKVVSPLVKDLIDNKKDIYSNTIDPFSAVIDCLIRNTTLENWKLQEEGRQAQKTLQNTVGNLHEYTIDCFDEWEHLQIGKVIDVVNHKAKIIAEIKNKWNTTKGNHKKSIYDDLASVLHKDCVGYTAYYVEILPKNKASYNKPFTPSDNTTKKNRPKREDIRVIDGASFYEIVSGEKGFIKRLYREFLVQSLQKSIEKLNQTRSQKLDYPKEIIQESLFGEFIDKTFE